MTTPAPVRRVWLSAVVLLAVIVGLWFALRQSEELTFARRNLPAACIQALADMPAKDAKERGVALRDCARRHMKPDRKASVIASLDTSAYLSVVVVVCDCDNARFLRSASDIPLTLPALMPIAAATRSAAP